MIYTILTKILKKDISFKYKISNKLIITPDLFSINFPESGVKITEKDAHIEPFNVLLNDEQMKKLNSNKIVTSLIDEKYIIKLKLNKDSKLMRAVILQYYNMSKFDIEIVFQKNKLIARPYTFSSINFDEEFFMFEFFPESTVIIPTK